MIDPGENLFQIGSALAQALWSGLWIGVLLAAVVFFYLRYHKGLNAASRHVAWYAALVVIASLPAVSFGSSLARTRVETIPSPLAFTYAQPAAMPVQPKLSGTETSAETNTPAAAPAVARSPLAIERVGIAVAGLLGAIAVARIAVLFVGLLGLWKVKRASRKVDPALSPTLARTMERDAGARTVSLRLSDTLDAPAAAGFRSPAILLPADLVDTLDDASLDQIAMHEYAHLRRYDDWTNLFQRFVERVFWFNPAIWFVGGRIDLEREIACDDWAVAGCDGVSGYADCLWQLARHGRVPSFAATAPGAFLTKNQITARIEHLLQRRRDGAPTLRTSRLVAIAPVLAGALALVAGRAPGIDLHAQAPAPTAAQLQQIRLDELALENAQVVGIGVHPVADGEKIHFDAPLAPGLIAAGVEQPGSVFAKAPQASGDCPSTHRGSARTSTTRSTVTTLAYAAAVSASRTATVAPPSVKAKTAVAKAKTVWIVVPATAVHATMTQMKVVVPVEAQAVGQAISVHVSSSVGAALGHARVDVVHEQPADASASRHTHSAIHAMTPRHFTFVEAAADATDNMSFGPNDRDLIAHCSGCDLSNKDLHGADLHGLTLTGDDLSGADLRGANLRQTVLTGVDLSNARLDNADLRGAVLTGTDISGATFMGAKTDGIRLVGMQLTNEILASSSVRSLVNACAGCDLSNLDLHGRDLHGVTLDGADLSGTDLSGANLQGAHFNGVDLSGVKFRGADLRGAVFNGCDLSNVDLTAARTDGIEIRGSSLNDTTTDSGDSNP